MRRPLGANHGASGRSAEDGVVELREGDFHTVKAGVRHNPVAQEECWVLLIETVTTAHTGELTTGRTRSIDEQLS
jgi:mannose-6-phosphate isomerase-like protein (cupin superfamily)